MEGKMKDAYKIKSTSVDPKKLRLHRRSLDWKQHRLDEANKGRNIQNLSPLQELSSNTSNITITTSYEGKTPVKRDVIDNGKKRNLRTVDDVKRELVKWKKEKELKKKMEKQKQIKKPSFKFIHTTHDDAHLYQKDAKKGSQMCPVSGFVSRPAQTKPVAVESHPPARKQKTAAKKTETVKPTPSKFVEPAPVTGRVTRSQTASKVAKNVPAPSRPKAATTTTRVTRNTEKPKTAATSKKTDSKKKEKKRPQNVNLERVSTFRGISFAPEDFTFTGPSNISTFEFKPLSPASTAKFLYPATTSFIDTDPKRCSTPKLNSSPGSKFSAVNCSVSLVDVSKMTKLSEKSTVTSASEVSDGNGIGEKSERTDSSSKTNEQNTPMDVKISQTETRRVTRGARRSILGAVPATSTEVSGQPTMPSGESTMESVSVSSVAQVQSDAVSSAAPKQLTMWKESPTPSNTQKEEKTIPKRMTRSLRRSMCLSPPSEALSSPKKVATPRNTDGKLRRSIIAPLAEAVTDKPIEDEVFSKSPTKKNDANGDESINQTPERKVTRRTMSNLAPFIPPSNDCLVLSASRSKRKRRKTQHDRPVNPKSPEEWVNLLRNSPMVEMNRRTPKAKTLEPIVKLDLDMDFDDVLSPTSKSTANDSASIVASSSDDDVSTPHMTTKISNDSAPSTTDLSNNQTLPPSEKDQSDTALSEQLSVSQPQEEKSSEPEEHNVKYFRKLMSTETNIFNGYCSKWEDISEKTPDLTEEVEGQIRSCIGQAQLLISQRFKQFTGLVDNCEFGTGEKETTLSDLQGFWDMIYYQVEDVHTKFAKLDKLKANNWREDKPAVQKKTLKKKVAAKPAVKRPPVASKFAAFRAQMKKKQTAPDIICHEDPVVTFDGGFFKVSSPKKTPKFHCEAGSPQPKASSSSAEKDKSEKSEEKPPQSKSTPLSEILSPAVDSLGLTTLRTPSRKSYVPVNPSPLLRDITPQVTSKSRTARHSFSKKLCSGSDTKPEAQNKENETDDVFTSDSSEKTVEMPSNKNNATVTGTPRTKITPRRSLRSRRSLCDMSSDSSPSTTVKDTDNSNDFFKLLQPCNTSRSKASGNISGLDNEASMWNLSSAEATGHTKVSPAIPKRRSSSLKQLPSAQRRRSTRRSVHFSASPTIEYTNEVASIVDVPDCGRVSDDMLIFTPPGQKSSLLMDDDNTDYISQNAGATPAFQNSRPSLLFTPPQDTSSSNTTTHTEIPTDILISFTP